MWLLLNEKGQTHKLGDYIRNVHNCWKMIRKNILEGPWVLISFELECLFVAYFAEIQKKKGKRIYHINKVDVDICSCERSAVTLAPFPPIDR